jgi:nuclear pore complex protein Nup210
MSFEHLTHFVYMVMQIIVEVSIPSVLSILSVFPVEVPVGTQLHAAVALQTSNGSSHD